MRKEEDLIQNTIGKRFGHCMRELSLENFPAGE